MCIGEKTTDNLLPVCVTNLGLAYLTVIRNQNPYSIFKLITYSNFSCIITEIKMNMRKFGQPFYGN